MRRGGHGSNLQGSWRRRHDATILSNLHFRWWWTSRECICITVFATCTITAIAILIWSSRLGRVSKPDVRVRNVPSSNSGIVFPLYHYYRQFQNGSGRLGWRENRARNGRRGILGDQGHSNTLMNVLGGHRLKADDIEHFYVEMNLGVPPTKYNFHVDTGSGVSWVYCNIRSIVPKNVDWGPNGFFVPEDTTILKCTGNTAKLCQQLQALSGYIEPCDNADNYRCLFIARYADDSSYIGFAVNGSFTVAMKDKSEMNVFGLFGCVVDKMRIHSEVLPLITDGLIGLGNCKGTLLDQWSTNKAIRQSVLGVCLAKEVELSSLPSPAVPVGYISMGMDFKEKFDQRNSVWSKLTNPGKMILCAFAANLLSISFDGNSVVFGSTMLFDTGSDLTYLATTIYHPILQTLDDYATSRGYLRVLDNPIFIVAEQRGEASPIHDFLPLTFAFEGIPSASVQYLIVQPVNYLVWDVSAKKLCVNILQDVSYSVSNLGADLMREYLFIFDIENQRVRWQSNNCELN